LITARVCKYSSKNVSFSLMNSLLSGIMMRNNFILHLALLLAIMYCQTPTLQSQTFTDFIFAEYNGNATGWNLTGNAQQIGGEIRLTPASNGQSGGFFWQVPLNLSVCQQWTAEFEYRIRDGNGADGIAFCYLRNPPAGFVTGQGIGIPGNNDGFVVAVDTYNNCSGQTPQWQVRYITPGQPYNECNPPGQPTSARNTAYRAANYVPVRIEYDNGNITLFWNNAPVAFNVAPFYNANFPGFFGFTSSTGGSRDAHWVRNVVIKTTRPESNAGPDRTFCSGESAQLGAAAQPGFTYNWSPATGLSSSTVANPTVTLTNGTGTAQQFVYTVETDFNGIGCTSTDQVTVTVLPATAAGVTVSPPAATICAGGSVTLTVSGMNNPVWSPATGLNTTTGSTVVANPAANTTYTITGTSAATGCQTSTQVQVTIGATATVTVVADNKPNLCPGESTDVLVGGLVTSTIQWFDGANNLIPSANGSQILPGIAPPAGTSQTFTVRGQTGTGCPGEGSITISTSSAMTITLAAVGATCGNANGGINLTVSGGQPPYSFQWSDGSSNQNLSNVTGGQQYIVAVTDAFGCEQVRNLLVPTTPGITAVSATQQAESCLGSLNGQLTASATGGTPPFQFSLDGGPFQASATFTGLAAGAYVITARDANGCLRDGVGEVLSGFTFGGLSFTATDAGCSGNSGTVTVTPTGGTGAIQYQLNTGAFQASNTFGGLSAGLYTITARDANNCTISDTVRVVAGTGFGGTLTATPTAAACTGVDNGSIAASATGGTLPYEFQLNSGAFQTSGNFTGLAPGSYTVTVRDASGCGTTQNVTVGTGPGVTGLTLTPTNAACAGISNGSISATAAGGTAPFQYQLGTGAFQASGNFTGLAAGSYSITARDANGCTRTESVTITNGPGVTGLTLVGTDPSCAGNDGQIVASPTGGTTPYEFQLGAGAFQPSGTFTGVGAGTQNVTVRDANGCTRTESVTLSSPASFSITAAGTNATCAGGTDGSLTITPDAGAPTLEYSIDGGTTFQASPSFTGLAPGTYQPAAREVGTTCVVTAPAVVIGAPGALRLSVANTTSPTCFNDTDGQVTLAATGGTAPYTFTRVGGASQPSATFTGLAAGNASFTVSDANGCTLGAPIQVNLAGPDPMQVTVDSLVPERCAAQNGAIRVSARGGTAPYTYVWNTNPPTQGQVLTDLVTGQYTVTVTDSRGCEVSQGPIIVGFEANTTADFAFEPESGCAPLSITFENLSSTNANNFSWDFGDGTTSTLQNPTHTYAAPGNYTVTLISRAGNSCADTLRRGPIRVSELVQPAFSSLPALPGVLPTANATVVFVNQTGGASRYVWSFGDGATSTDPNPTHRYTSPGVYCVTLTAFNIDDCPSLLEQCAFEVINDEILIPNVFTPNGDGVNDRFEIEAPQGVNRITFWVYDRWGRLQFKGESLNEAWSGGDAPAGVYFYTVEAELRSGIEVRRTGNVTLIR
jgi:gliding motility-associated-like protein